MKKIIVVILLCIIIVSCNKNDELIKDIVDINILSDEVIEEKAIAILEEKPKEVIKPELIFDLNIGESKYDDLVFKNIEESKLVAIKYAVVANNGVSLYDEIDLYSNSDLKKLKHISDIPIGTIIPIESEVRIEGEIWNDHFQFKKDTNYFYVTNYNKIKGLVWGANLIFYDDLKKATKTSFNYTKDIKSSFFTPYNGNYILNQLQQQDIELNRIIFQTIQPSEYEITATSPDDMVSIYQKDSKQRDNSIFLTTDLLTHTQHILFNNFLQSEEINMIPKLEIFIDRFIDSISNLELESELSQYMLNYFNIPKLLLNYSSEDNVNNDLLKNESREIIEEYNLIINHAKPQLSPVLKYNQDYSKYIPRGHYTKSDELKAYFLTMVWFAQTNMTLKVEKNKVPTDLDILNTKMAIVLNNMLIESDELHNLWKSLFDPITYLIGESADLSFYDTLNLLPKEILDDIKIVDFLKSDTFKGKSNNFRLFGSRFTIDSDIHSKLSVPKLSGRSWVSGLDIMAAFGSKTAFNLLTQSSKDKIYWEEYKSIISDELLKYTDSSDLLWSKSYYSRNLELIKQLTQFEQNSSFYFTEKGRWNKKSLLSAHGSWAELRHDTILYVKQVMSLTSFEPEELLTFDTILYPRPIHFVEPNIEFFKTLNILITEIHNYSILIESNPIYIIKFSRLQEVVTNLTEIVNLELTNSPISNNQNDYISEVPNILADIISSKIGEQSEMPIIADVFTQLDEGKVLEIGTGLPKRMFVALNDEHGGKRIATGYTFSYYEFQHPIDDRLTNEKWRAQIYTPFVNLNSKLPFWLK
ncbi:MAG: DUF3160 domain-containing protein [Spirochaetaceae bacterium]